MRYSIVKFENPYGGKFYQIRIIRAWFQAWLKDAEGEVRCFPTREQAHAHLRELDPADEPLAPPTAQRP